MIKVDDYFNLDTRSSSIGPEGCFSFFHPKGKVQERREGEGGLEGSFETK